MRWIKPLLSPRVGLARWLLLGTLILLFGLMSGGHLDALKDHLDNDAFALSFGDNRITIYSLLKGALSLILISWAAATIVETGDNAINGLTAFRSSDRALFSKIFQIACYVIAGVIALDYIGIDWKTVTIFGGAIGIGLGFGLQKIASNFISGFILLMEKGIEADDLIELSDGTAGFMRKTKARYTLLETFDGKEIMIPNEDFISNRVTNWTYSTNKARIAIPVAVAYGADLVKARELLLEAAIEHPKCLADPAPLCFMRSFGEYAAHFTTFFWIQDVVEGTFGVQSEVMYAIVEKFRANNIDFPYPRSEVRILGEGENRQNTPIANRPPPV
jgi:small-conductance mechanosensitive channel